MDMDTPFMPGSSQAAAASPLPQPKFTPPGKAAAVPGGVPFTFKASQSQPQQSALPERATFTFSSSFNPLEQSDPKNPAEADNDGQPSAETHAPQEAEQGGPQAAKAHDAQPVPPAAANPFPFFVANRPMDSRISEACAKGFMGIDLTSSPPKPSTATDAMPASQGASHDGASASFTTKAHQSDAFNHAGQGAKAPAAGPAFASAAPYLFGTGQAPTAPGPFTPGVNSAAKKVSKDQPRRVIHDAFQLGGNIQTKLNLGNQFTAQAAAGKQEPEPVIDLTESSKPAAETDFSASAPSRAQPAEPGRTQESANAAPTQSSYPQFVFGASRTANPSDTASTSVAGQTLNSSSNRNHVPSQMPFVFGAANNAPATAPSFAFAAQQQQSGGHIQANWAAHPVGLSHKSGSASATAAPQTAFTSATAAPQTVFPAATSATASGTSGADVLQPVGAVPASQQPPHAPGRLQSTACTSAFKYE